jgi:hypothetical protein
MKKREDISTEEFRRFWHSTEFNGLIDRMIGHVLTVEVKKNLTLDIEMNKLLQDERNAKPAFDAVLEVVWQSGGDLSALMGNQAFQQLIDEMHDVQAEYVDFQESRRFFTEYGDSSV